MVYCHIVNSNKYNHNQQSLQYTAFSDNIMNPTELTKQIISLPNIDPMFPQHTKTIRLSNDKLSDCQKVKTRTREIMRLNKQHSLKSVCAETHYHSNLTKLNSLYSTLTEKRERTKTCID